MSSEFCTFFPTAAQCQVAPEPEPEVVDPVIEDPVIEDPVIEDPVIEEDPIDDVIDEQPDAPVDDGEKMEDGHKDGDHEKMEHDMDMDKGMMHLDPTHGQLAYTFVAISSTVHYALEIFKWKHLEHFDTDSWKNAQGGTNYYLLAKQIGGYSALGIWGVLSILQLLSNFGIASYYNHVAWIIAEVAGMAIMAVVELMSIYAYDKIYACENDDTCADQGVSAGYRSEMEWEMLKEVAIETAHGFELWKEHSNWMWAQWINLDDETKIAMAEKMAGKKEEKMEEEEEEMEAAESEMFAF